jgi:hypothetical protein
VAPKGAPTRLRRGHGAIQERGLQNRRDPAQEIGGTLGRVAVVDPEG